MTIEQTALQQPYVPATKEELDEFEAQCIAWALEKKIEVEEEWRLRSFVYAFVQPEPRWISFADWDIYANVQNPLVPCNRVIRLDLIGGGQIKTVEKFRKYYREDGKPADVYGSSELILDVTAHCEAGIRRVQGTFTYAANRGPNEMDCYAVVFPPGSDQQIVDRVAATFRTIGNCADNFHAMLASGLRCACCNRPLRDEVSRLIGVGPDCARQHHIPHSQAAAEKRLELRRKLLGIS